MGSAFTWNGSLPGTTLQNLQGNTVLLAGVFLETVQISGCTYDYTRIGNAACITGGPNAVLTAMPISGKAPLTVNFSSGGGVSSASTEGLWSLSGPNKRPQPITRCPGLGGAPRTTSARAD